MTYVVAWRTKNSFYISADSAITQEGKNVRQKRPSSFFEERHVVETDKVVEEGVIKIHNIGNRILIGIAGDYDLANEFIGFMKIELTRNKNEPINSVFERCINMTHDIHGEMTLVLGIILEDGPQILSYNVDGKMSIKKDESIVHIGSMHEKPKLISWVDTIIKTLIEGAEQGQPDDHFLIYINVWIQSYGLHNVLMDIGVGGIITGAQLNENGVQWQKDSTYFLYGGPVFHLVKFLNVVYRHDGVIVMPNNSPEKIGFFTGKNSDDFEKMSLDLQPLLRPETILNSQYYVFFSSLRLQQVYIVTSTDNEKQKWFFIEIPGRDGMDIGLSLSKNLYDILTSNENELRIL